MEDEIIKELENVTNLRIFPNTIKVVTIDFELDAGSDFGLRMRKEQFGKFQEWLISKGFVGAEIKTNELASLMFKRLLTQLGYVVTRDDRRRGIMYKHVDGKKTVIIVYAVGDVVTVYEIVYIEES